MEKNTASMVASTAVEKPSRAGIFNREFGLEWPASLWFNLAIAGCVSFLYALFLFGPHMLNPHSITWVHGDPATYYIGWASFRQDPSIHWPIAYTDRIGYPIGDSISFLDVNPLLAVLSKILSPLLPEPFQYLGLEVVLACTLQFFFALRLFRLMLGSNPFAVLLPSLYFLISPSMTYRLGGHYTLSNHWLLTAALLAFFLTYREPAISSRRFVTMALVLAGISVSVNPYLAFQVGLLLTAAVIGLLWRRRLTLLAAIGVLGAVATVSITVAYVFGFIIPGGQGYAGPGYRYYSMNLLSPLDPSLFGSLVFRALPHFTEGQYEGYNYLGAGVILLAAVVLPIALLRRSRMPRVQWRSAIPLFLCCLVLTLLALSTQMTAGSKLLVDLDPSQKASPYLAILRCSGRLFWAPSYTILLALLVAPYLFLSRRRASALIAVAFAVQLADTIPVRRWVHSYVSQPFEKPLKSVIWSKLGLTYRNLMVMPAWQCGSNTSPGGEEGYATFGMLAVEQNMRTNSYRSGRQTEANLKFHCGESISALTQGPLSSSSVYVVTAAIASRIVSAGLGNCHNLDGFILCSAKNDLGLGLARWESPTELWIRHCFKIIFARDPTGPELLKWTNALNQRTTSPAAFIADLLTSPEWDHHSLPRFWAYLDTRGRWPTFAEWVKNNPLQPVTSAERDREDKHARNDRNRAIAYMLYFAILERDPDSPGLALWSETLTRTSPQDVASQFFKSPEYMLHGDFH